MNSVQFLRPVLMVMWLSVVGATAVQADATVVVTTIGQLPDGVELRGKPVGAYTWSDKQGKNLLVLGEQVNERDDDGAQSAFVYAAQYLLDGDHPRRLWMLYDDVQHCEFDAAARFNPDATKVTDLLGDGTSRVTVGYGRTCTSDVSPNDFKLIMHVGKSQKYRLRGIDRNGASWWDEDAGALQGMPLPKDCSAAAQEALVSQYKEQGTELPLPGCYTTEEDFAKAPRAYLDFMRSHWFALMQKQDADWGQLQTPERPDELE
ncbi:MAG: hypothetical protein GAK37_02118 [Pseudomonas sp.]|nr:MAG: hypothetical protein GAK37_02118 [Pseudomonas sp.]